MNLPTTLYCGQTERVCSPNLLNVQLQLGFGMQLSRRIILQGVAPALPASRADVVMRSLILLMGGKRLLLELNPNHHSECLTAMVYLEEEVAQAPEAAMRYPMEWTVHRLCLNTFVPMILTADDPYMLVSGVIKRRPRKGDSSE